MSLNQNPQQTNIPLIHPPSRSSPSSPNNNSNDNMKYLICGVMAASIIIVFAMMQFNKDSVFSGDHGMSMVFNQSQNNDHHRHHPSAMLMKQPKNMTQAKAKMPKPDKICKYIQRYTINGPQIVYNGPSQKWTQLVSYKPIPYSQPFTTKILITFSSNNHIILGITNHQLYKQQSSFFNQDTYAYYGQNGCLWAQGKLMLRDERGYKQKDVVEIDVHLWEGLVQWKVNGEIRGQVYSQNLMNKDKVYVSYLEMFQKQDAIRSLE